MGRNLLVSLDEIETTTKKALESHGASVEVASLVAHAVRTAEERGNKICGLYYVESYCLQLRTGRVDGAVEPVVTNNKPGTVRVDGRFGFAQSAFAAGFNKAIEVARSNGICGYSVEHTQTCTSLGYFTEQLAKSGMLAIGATNASAVVAPPGGSVPVLGTNPIAMAVPDGKGGISFQFDFSTSAIALGKITMAAAANEPIPLGWAVDKDGNPTTNAKDALEGSLLSAGGYKGYGLGLMAELLAGALTGSRLSIEVPPLKTPEGEPHDLGQFYVVIDVEAYDDMFMQRLEKLADAIESQAGARLPGANIPTPDEVEVDDVLWSTVKHLSSN
ncbi:MAG: Ldh family oxidoreductase [Acidimicrobiales bacterium]|nr:Ldh family oxidoreductase [Acidimicrobiales bacterium]